MDEVFESLGLRDVDYRIHAETLSYTRMVTLLVLQE